VGQELVTIIRLNSKDIEQFYALFTDLIQNEIPELKDRSDFFLNGDYSKLRVYSALEYSKSVILGCFVDNKLVGFLWGNDGYAGLGFVSWLMIDQQYRKRGLATKLLKYYEDTIKELGGHVVELYCFERLKPFYERNGYSVIGIRPKGYFKLKQFIMSREL